MGTSYAFDDFVLDDSAFALSRGGTPLAIQPKALDVLLYLIRHNDRVVSKQELLENVWSGIVVGESALAQAVLVVRRALADDGDEQRLIRTVRGRGYRFVAALRVVVPPERTQRAVQDDPFFGREASMALLASRLDAAITGRGSTVTLAGDAGIGKTRLCEELCEAARTRGARVLFGRSFEGEGAPPFWPWTQVLRGHLDEGGAGIDPALVEELARLVPGLRDDVRAEPVEDDFRTFHAVTRFLKLAAAKEPLLVVLEDVHLADVASLLLLRFCGKAFEKAKVLLVATFRDAALAGAPALARTLGALRRENPQGHIELRGLDVDDTERLAQAILRRPDARELALRLHAKTAGNPLFLTQLLHVIASEEWLGETDAMSTSTMLGAESMKEAIRLHVEALPPECTRILSLASVFGAELPIAPVAAVVGVTPTGLLDAIEQAFRERIITKRSAGVVRFLHVLVRDALYAKLAPAERVRLHARAASALAAHYGAPVGAQIAEIARQFVHGAAAGHAGDAALWSARAARWQLAMGAKDAVEKTLAGVALALDATAHSDPEAFAQAEREMAELAQQPGAPAKASELVATLKARAKRR